ncbi:MAG: hypothetical protein R3E89_16150 [Thiolinea sp.]
MRSSPSPWLGVGALWFLENFELKTVDEYTGYKGEARNNNRMRRDCS